MNSGFDPVIVAPGRWKVQTATQQKPFRFGGSQIPLHLGMIGGGIDDMNTMGRGIMKINRPKIPEALMRERMSGGWIGETPDEAYANGKMNVGWNPDSVKEMLYSKGITQGKIDKYMAKPPKKLGMGGSGVTSSVMPMDLAVKKEIKYEIRRLGGKKTKKGKMVDDALTEAGSDIVKLRKLLDMAQGINQIVMR